MTLIVAYYAPAEIGCFLSLGWPAPTWIIDLYAEFRRETNALARPVRPGSLRRPLHAVKKILGSGSVSVGCSAARMTRSHAAIQEEKMETTARASAASEMGEQYSLGRILGIWALAAAPMGILSWIVFPLLAPDFESDPLEFGVIRLVLLALGLVWLFVLSMIIVRREEGDLRWATVKRRLRLNAPRDPKTGETRRKLWLWVVPFLVGVAVIELVLNTPLENAWVSVFPFLAEPEGYSFDAILGSQEILQRLVGAWWFLALFVVQAIFNTILGEELLFRGVLLPKMEGVFRRGSWVANSVLFGLYHVHAPWVIPKRSLPASCTHTLPIATGVHGCL